ncbi:unnamed protein product [Brassicogethes aeneus]|uniref:Uncharacterized protein n=1 Tax=Brassicogethes aeneus TaxID=1431903 RepID=A0A9P0FAD0_BRAAE|nr:unnamed protein product [Brassicogethes aeneus]
MDEASVGVPNAINRSDLDGEELLFEPLESFFNGNFLPPPPRPFFLDETATPDGLTTCDLCSWAWQNSNSIFTLEKAIGKNETSGELGWVLTLVIVSLVSALIGAIIMIIVLHCRRLKHSETNETERGSIPMQRHPSLRPPISTPDDKTISTITPATFPNVPSAPNANSGVWSWLSRRSVTTPSQLDNPPSFPAENHYTHMEDSYNTVGEALYAELDRDSNSPAYQNSAYTDPDAQQSSAPSSAYYSDLSVTTVPERAYEVVGLVTMTPWDSNCANSFELRRPSARLAAISENVTVPSDYV